MRLLKANEIEVRVGSCKEKGASLLLYKNARVDMNIMDETFGSLNWKREHLSLNGNNYCRVSVYNKDISEWVYKEDCGTESMADKEKGEASDSFKRACVNWGIGRELYTSPFIWVTKLKIESKQNKYTTKDEFFVKEIGYNDNREIVKLVIVNQKNERVFATNEINSTKKETFEISENEFYCLAKELNYDNQTIQKIIEKKIQKKELKELTESEYLWLIDSMKKNPQKSIQEKKLEEANKIPLDFTQVPIEKKETENIIDKMSKVSDFIDEKRGF